jgi:predicted esterase
MACPNQAGSICWSWNQTVDEISASAAIVQETVKRCFPPGVRFGLLGFSNGGYLLSAIYRNCRMQAVFPDADWIVLVGSARWNGPLGPPKSLVGCGSLSILSGAQDEFNSDLNRNYISRLLEKGADAEEVSYDGGHELPFEPLRDVLARRFE